MPPPINPHNPPQVDERNLRKLLTEGLGSGGEDVEIGNVLRRGGKRGPMGADATFRGKIRPDQPGLRYNLLLIADADRGGQPRFVNLDTLRWVKALQRMARPWGDPQASHNTIPREERRYAKDATYTTSGGNLGVRHFYPPGYGPLDDEDAPESRQPKAPISELRGPAGRERFAKWLTEGGIGTRTRDFSEGENMDGLGVEFSAPGRGMLNDGGRWSRGRFMPTGAAERLAQSLGVQRIPMAPRQRFSAGASSTGVGAVNHFFPGQRQRFALGGEQQFGIRSITPTASAYLDRLRQWRTPGSDVEPPDMPEREELDVVSGNPSVKHPKHEAMRWLNPRSEIKNIIASGRVLPEYQQLNVRLGRVPHGGLDYDPSEMSDRVPTDAEKREIVGPNVWDTRMVRIPLNLPSHVREMLSQYELERPNKNDDDEYDRRFAAWQANPTRLPQPMRPMLERHNLRYPNHPAHQEPRVNVPGSGGDLRTRLLEMELNDPSVPHDLLANSAREDMDLAAQDVGFLRANGIEKELERVRGIKNTLGSIKDRVSERHLPGQNANQALQSAIRRNISRHRFALGSQDFALRPQPQLGALGNAQLVPIYLPQGNAPAVGVTPTGGYAPPPRNAALVPQRRFALGEEEMGGGMPGLGMQQQFRVGDRPDYLNKPEVEGGRSVFPQRRSYGTSSTNYDPAGQADRLNTAQFPLGDRIKSRAIGQIAPIKPSYQPDEMARQLNRAAIPRDRYGNVARKAGGERSWGDWWQGLNNGLEDWIKGPGMSAVKSGGRALLQGGVDAIGGLGYRQLGGGVRDVGRGLGDALGGNVARGLGGIARGVGRVGLGLGQGVLSGLGGIAKSLYGDYTNRSRQGVNPQRVGAASYSPSDKAFMRSTRQKYSLGEQDFSREDDFGDLLSQLGLGSDIPPVADEPLMVPPQTPEEMMRARATINTAHGPRDLYDMDPEKISGYLRGQGVMTSGKPTQNRLRSVYGASGRIQPERAQQIVQGPHETGVAGRVADIIGDLPQQQAPSETPEQRRRRVSGRELGSFARGEQDFGLWDTIKGVVSQANPVASYRNLRSAGHGRLASGAMVGGGLLGDAMLTGFHPPLVSLGLGRYAQGKAQAADRASDERRAEWMRG